MEMAIHYLRCVVGFVFSQPEEGIERERGSVSPTHKRNYFHAHERKRKRPAESYTYRTPTEL